MIELKRPFEPLSEKEIQEINKKVEAKRKELKGEILTDEDKTKEKYKGIVKGFNVVQIKQTNTLRRLGLSQGCMQWYSQINGNRKEYKQKNKYYYQLIEVL